ncbi:MAG: lipopolysaccharide biosynthesis protein RfbH, partial [Desulfobacteraceae bacterium]
MGEGGALVTSDPLLKRVIGSFRDWGRDCWCKTGCDNTCGKRFGWKLGTLPEGYDHKYVYSHIGYNLKITDLQASIGLEQLRKLPTFIKARKENWQALFEGLRRHENYLILPQVTTNSEPCWFGFPLTVKEGAPFTRDKLVAYLERNKIATRSLFAGNIIRHPAFEQAPYRLYGRLEHTDRIMNDTFWIGVYPGITQPMLDYMLSRIDAFFESYP